MITESHESYLNVKSTDNDTSIAVKFLLAHFSFNFLLFMPCTLGNSVYYELNSIYTAVVSLFYSTLVPLSRHDRRRRKTNNVLMEERHYIAWLYEVMAGKCPYPLVITVHLWPITCLISESSSSGYQLIAIHPNTIFIMFLRYIIYSSLSSFWAPLLSDLQTLPSLRTTCRFCFVEVLRGGSEC